MSEHKDSDLAGTWTKRNLQWLGGFCLLIVIVKIQKSGDLDSSLSGHRYVVYPASGQPLSLLLTALFRSARIFRVFRWDSLSNRTEQRLVTRAKFVAETVGDIRTSRQMVTMGLTPGSAEHKAVAMGPDAGLDQAKRSDDGWIP